MIQSITIQRTRQFSTKYSARFTIQMFATTQFRYGSNSYELQEVSKYPLSKYPHTHSLHATIQFKLDRYWVVAFTHTCTQEIAQTLALHSHSIPFLSRGFFVLYLQFLLFLILSIATSHVRFPKIPYIFLYILLSK